VPEISFATEQAVGPVAITSLLLSNGAGGLVPAADVNIDPNNPIDPAAQHAYNTVCIQVRRGCLCRMRQGRDSFRWLYLLETSCRRPCLASN
jgi:hypothetical protein